MNICPPNIYAPPYVSPKAYSTKSTENWTKKRYFCENARYAPEIPYREFEKTCIFVKIDITYSCEIFQESEIFEFQQINTCTFWPTHDECT